MCFGEVDIGTEEKLGEVEVSRYLPSLCSFLHVAQDVCPLRRYGDHVCSRACGDDGGDVAVGHFRAWLSQHEPSKIGVHGCMCDCKAFYNIPQKGQGDGHLSGSLKPARFSSVIDGSSKQQDILLSIKDYGAIEHSVGEVMEVTGGQSHCMDATLYLLCSRESVPTRFCGASDGGRLV